MEKKKILFICIGNSVRSQMAEALTRNIGHDLFEVYSAGLRPAGVHRLSEYVMDEEGISMEGHFSEPIEKYTDVEFDYIIPLDEVVGASLPEFPGNPKVLYWYMDDPIRVLGTDEMKLRAFRFTRDMLKRRITAFIQNEKAKA